VLVKASEFGSRYALTQAMITPDGRTVYFESFRDNTSSLDQIRAADVRTGRVKFVASAVFASDFAADPAVRRLIALYSSPASPTVRAALINLRTGRFTYLPVSFAITGEGMLEGGGGIYIW
jgi:hypothetical protein